MNPLVRTILATISYYDAMDYPLTLFEIWRFLSFEDINVPAQYRKERTLKDVQDIVDHLVRDKHIVCTNGFYALIGREHLVRERQRRTILSIDKLYRMRRCVKFLRHVPFVRMVLVTGRLAMKHAEENSDWDVLIVLKRGFIWTGRFFVTVVTHVLGRRRTDAHHADRLCLNYFITTGSLKISLDDRYSAHEYMMARPLFASINPQRFLSANLWIKRFRPHFDTLFVQSPYFIDDTATAYIMRHFCEWCLRVIHIEPLLQKIQYVKIMKNPKTSRENSVIVANDRELIFLPCPHSKRVLAAYHKRCRSLGLRSCA